jgi:WD40 repeat protein
LAAAFAGVGARADDDGPTRVEVRRRQIEQIKHGDGFRSLAISRDGKLLLTASEDQTARLFDTATGEPVGQPMRHRALVKQAVLSADGKFVATAGGDAVARVWEARTGKQIGSDMRHVGAVNAVAISPDGKYVLTGGQDQTVRLWDAKTGKPFGPVMQPPTAAIHVAFTPDGRSLVAALMGGMVRKWDVATGKEVGLACSRGVGATALDFSRDGRFLITCSRNNGVRLWDTLTGEPLCDSVGAETYFGDIALSPDASVFLTSGTTRKPGQPPGVPIVQLWDTQTLKPIGQPFANKNALAYDPTGKVIAVGGDDGVVEIWEVRVHRAKAETVRPEAVEGYWAVMAAANPAESYRATSALIRAPGATVPFLEKHLKPTVPAEGKDVNRLIEELDDESFDVREKAERQLAAHRGHWEAKMRSALAKDPPDETRTRLQRVLDGPDEAVASPERLRELRAVQVLEAIGSDEARRLLRTLAGGAADAVLTREARAALDHLASRQ